MSNQQTVIMVPAKAKKQDLITDTNTIVYMPLATTKNPGVVKIGEGLKIDADGVLTFDKNEVTILQIAKNGEIIHPDENKIVNIILNKNDVGLSNVDNTSDINKPISIYQQEALNKKLNIYAGANNIGKMLFVNGSGEIDFRQMHQFKTKQDGVVISDDTLSFNFSNLFKLTKTSNYDVTVDVGDSLKSTFNNVSYNPSNGVLSFTRTNGSVITVDLPLELLIKSGYYNPDTKEIILVLANDEEIKIPIDILVGSYYADETTLSLTRVDGRYVFVVKDSGITTDKIANYSVTDDKIVSVSGSKITGVVEEAIKATEAVNDEYGQNIAITYRKISDSYNKEEIATLMRYKADLTQLPEVLRLGGF